MKNLSMKKIMKKEQGFTLLELLVVITLLAILSVGALVAYEGVGDNAQATAAANNTAGADRAIRNYKAVTLNYPNQWDSLVTTTGATPAFLATQTTAKFANLALPVSAAANDFRDTLDQRIEGVGIEELQARLITAATPNVEPNLQHNEGALGASALTDVVEDDFDNFTNLSILPTFGTVACSVNGVAMAAVKLDGTAISLADGQRQNAINDALGTQQCNLVLALGFGHDAAHSTNTSSVAIATAPTFVSKNINPAKNYARYVALFHVGADTAAPLNDITVDELFAKPRLLAVVDTEGNAIDENIAKQNP
ncbi:type II secretion system protein [Methylotenera sp.]|uniref:type II secretion system protein n=1 Tax=Methylotenera sp. TaxID=2051956 RepID=UPI0027314099|nr:prepilin-type N-terminal cleavage/methylation domain-containing protein [Methylotenera sp.]MDP2229929.1 prepilin-type N-terminal cleavage/methylation domain-containing protein [Methylotenera sp.]